MQWGADSLPRRLDWESTVRAKHWKSCAPMCEKQWTATSTKRWKHRVSSGCTLSATKSWLDESFRATFLPQALRKLGYQRQRLTSSWNFTCQYPRAIPDSTRKESAAFGPV